MQRAKHIASRYRPRYFRSLAYMLQSTEYDVGDYLRWYHRTQDFSRVEQRGRFVATPKAKLTRASAWGLWAGLVGAGLAFAVSLPPILAWVAALGVVIVAPWLTAYLILIPQWLGRHVLQRPLELRRTRAAARRLAEHPATKIAVAGSYGKTTMREILRQVLGAGLTVAAPPHSYNTPAGIAGFVASLSGKEDVLVFELGEYYPGDVRMLSRLTQPEVGVITGVNEAHLHKFGTVDRTTSTIFELADWLGKRPVYVNAENRLAKAAARTGHLLYNREGLGEWRVSKAQTSLAGTSFTLTRGSEKLELRSQLLGLHQIGPLVAAVDIAANLGLTPDQITAGVAATRPFDHRLQPRRDGSGVTMLDDSYNGNPDGVQAVIEFLAGLNGRRWYVTPGLVEMGERTAAVHRTIGRQLAEAGIEQVVLVQNSVTPFIAEGLKKAGFAGELHWYDSGPQALAALPHLTVSGDIVLLQNDWPDQYQ